MSQKITNNARALRRRMTKAEHRHWQHLRAHRLYGGKFKRQQPVGPYIVDFVCFQARLIIEVDGGQHLNCAADKRRDAWLKQQGFQIFRVWNNEVLTNMSGVADGILQLLGMPSKQESIRRKLLSSRLTSQTETETPHHPESGPRSVAGTHLQPGLAGNR